MLNNANWPQLPIAYEIHSYGVVNTLLHTFSPTLVAEVTVGLNHGKQTVEPLTQADLERNDRTQVGLVEPAAVLPGGEPGAHPPQRELRRRRGWRLAAALPHRDARRRGPLSVLRAERHLEHLRQPDQGHGRAQHEGGAVLRAHDPAGGALEHVQRQPSTSTATPPTRSIPTTRTPTRSSARSTATRKRRSIPTPTRGSRTSSGSFRTTGA